MVIWYMPTAALPRETVGALSSVQATDHSIFLSLLHSLVTVDFDLCGTAHRPLCSATLPLCSVLAFGPSLPFVLSFLRYCVSPCALLAALCVAFPLPPCVVVFCLCVGADLLTLGRFSIDWARWVSMPY